MGGAVPAPGRPAEGLSKRKAKEGKGQRRKGEGSVGRTQPGGKEQQKEN